MVSYDDLKRALHIRYGMYGHIIDIPGYQVIHYQHEIFTSRGRAFTFEDYQYTENGQAIFKERCRIYFDEFDDNLSDEQIVSRFVELLSERGPEYLNRR